MLRLGYSGDESVESLLDLPSSETVRYGLRRTIL